MGTEPERRSDNVEHEHDYEFVSEGYYMGSRPGYVYDEFYCRRCLERVAVDRKTGHKTVNPDPRWFERER